jgi:hypothetical protein
MSMEWYRAYHGMPYDTKLRVIARRTSQPMAVVVAIWTCMLDAASQHDPRGFIKIDPEEVAVVQDLELEVVEAVLQAFHDKGMIDENNHLTAWDKRQHTTSTERSRKYRDAKQQDATPSNTKQQSATQGNAPQRKNAPDTDTDYRTDTDSEAEADSKKDSKQKKKRTRAEKKEREKEKQQIGGQNVLQEMLDIWNEEVQSKLTNSHKAILTPKRKELLTVRWIEDFAEDIRAWRYYCEIIGSSDFCLGRIEGKNWTIDLSWAIESSEHVAKILEGGFSGGKHPAPPPACYEPELQTAWDHVLACFAGKYGKPACQSWLSRTAVQGAEPTQDGAFVIITCPNKFIQGWLEQHYLRDLNLWWAEHSYQSRRISGVQLETKEVKS